MISAAPDELDATQLLVCITVLEQAGEAGIAAQVLDLLRLGLRLHATRPSRNPYHMAIAWIDPSWLMLHIDMGLRSWMNASTSAGVILICARWLTPWPIGVAC